jgi:hypothetical protein
MSDLPGIKTYQPLIRNSRPYTPSQFKRHVHDWKPTERIWNGQTFKLFICTDHEKPVIQAYDLEVSTAEVTA